jgi:hypothetical protein
MGSRIGPFAEIAMNEETSVLALDSGIIRDQQCLSDTMRAVCEHYPEVFESAPITITNSYFHCLSCGERWENGNDQQTPEMILRIP